jgi:hypothetical protein
MWDFHLQNSRARRGVQHASAQETRNERKIYRPVPASRPLPWDQAALEPVTSARTIGLHYGKHHKTYVDKLNELVAGTKYAELSLEQVVQQSANDAEAKKIFNNAAQHWNHSFFWNCLKPGGGGAPQGDLAKRIDSDLGGIDAFRAQFEKSGGRDLRQRLGVAGTPGRQAADHLHVQRRHADHHGCNAPAHDRRLGARLLRRLREPPARVREGGDRQAAQLGFRPGAARKGQLGTRKAA